MKTTLFVVFIFLFACLIGCGENTSTNNSSGYTVRDELFYERSYDSVYGFGIGISELPYMQIKLKKIKITFEFNTNRPDTSKIRISAGHYPHYWWDTISTPGQYTIEHEFPTIQDSTERPYSIYNHCSNCYAVVRNFKAYRSY